MQFSCAFSSGVEGFFWVKYFILLFIYNFIALLQCFVYWFFLFLSTVFGRGREEVDC